MSGELFQRLDDLLDYHARTHEDVPFLVEDSGTLTFAQAKSRVAQIATSLQQAGLEKGDRIALFAKNSADYLLLILAGARLGVVPVAINYRLSAPEVKFIVEDAEAAMVFFDAELAPALAELGALSRICLVGQDASAPALSEWIDGNDGEFVRAEIEPDDVLAQMYTSGTTGFPKGVLLSHNNVLVNVHQTALGSEYTFSAAQEFLLVAPMYHAAGIMTAYTGLVHALTLVIHRDYEPQRVVDTLAARPIAAVTLVPAMLQFLHDNISDMAQRAFPSLELVYYGASPIPEPLLRWAVSVFDCDFTQGYGQTEANSIVAMLSPSDHRRALAGEGDILSCCGRAVFGTELKIVDLQGRDVDYGTSGEIVVRGPQVMQGYWRRPEATAETVRDGWLHTGDMGVLDERGYLRIVGRLKELIISGGENIYPAEIEKALETLAGLRECAVIGVPDERWGEVPLAAVVCEPGANLDAEVVREHCRSRLARYKVPAHVAFIEELPRNPSGKILKQNLKETIEVNV